MTGSDPFTLFGLTADATADELRRARRELAQTMHPDHGGTTEAMSELNAAFDAALAQIGAEPVPVFGRRQFDTPSFTVDALPAETFEALLVVASWIGEVASDDPPYVLEVMLDPPWHCWCRLDVMPDAGASTVSIGMASVEGREIVHVEQIRDLWVDQLNRLASHGWLS